MAGSRRRSAGNHDKEGERERNAVLHFPARRATETIGRKEALEEAEKAGFTLKPSVQRMLRLPPRLLRGMNEKLEFFDELSVQPFPSKEEDSPSFCFDHGLPAPAWVQRRYLSLEEKEGKKFLTFIDATRSVFVKGELAEQEDLAVKVYNKLIGAG